MARVCGTSEQMIFQHYRRWIPGLQTDAGHKVGRVFGTVGKKVAAEDAAVGNRGTTGGIEPPIAA